MRERIETAIITTIAILVIVAMLAMVAIIINTMIVIETTTTTTSVNEIKSVTVGQLVLKNGNVITSGHVNTLFCYQDRGVKYFSLVKKTHFFGNITYTITP